MEKTFNGQQKLRLCIGYAQNPSAEEQDAYDGVPMQLLINNILYEIISRLKGYVEPTGEPRHWRKVKDVA